MMATDIDNLKYPVGKFTTPAEYSKKLFDEWIQNIEKLPKNLKAAVQNLNDKQLDTPYREDGWTVRQVVHHLADSHMNAYIRFKLGMTEDFPTIKPYLEKIWAETPDGKEATVDVSLSLLESLHRRWVYYLRTLSEEDLIRKVMHPESNREMELRFLLALYSWHSRHHVAHITSLASRMGW